MSEQRHTTRNRTFLPARIEIVELGTMAPCTIRDLSESGARIQVDGTITLPQTFLLHIPRFDRQVRVTQAWRHGDTLGVSFEADANRSGRDIANARYVKKLEAEVVRLKLLLETIREDPARARYLLEEVA